MRSERATGKIALATGVEIPDSDEESRHTAAALEWEVFTRRGAQSFAQEAAGSTQAVEAALEEAVERARPEAARALQSALAHACTGGFHRAHARLAALHMRKSTRAKPWGTSVAQVRACTRWTPRQWAGLERLPEWAVRACLEHGGIEAGDESPARWIERCARERARNTGITIDESARPRVSVEIEGWPANAVDSAPLGAALACALSGEVLAGDAHWGAAHALEWEMMLGNGRLSAHEATERTRAGAREMTNRVMRGVRQRALEKIRWEAQGDAEEIARSIEEAWGAQDESTRRAAELTTDAEGEVAWRVPIRHPIEALASAQTQTFGGDSAPAAGHEMKCHSAMLVRASDPDVAWVIERERRTQTTPEEVARARKGTEIIARMMRGGGAEGPDGKGARRRGLQR